MEGLQNLGLTDLGLIMGGLMNTAWCQSPIYKKLLHPTNTSSILSPTAEILTYWKPESKAARPSYSFVLHVSSNCVAPLQQQFAVHTASQPLQSAPNYQDLPKRHLFKRIVHHCSLHLSPATATRLPDRYLYKHVWYGFNEKDWVGKL